MATGAAIADVSAHATQKINRAKDAGLYEYFCRNVLAGPCPADIDDQLKPFQKRGLGTRVDLADAFTRFHLQRSRKIEPGVEASDEDYVDAAYRTVLGREPDAGGRKDQLNFLHDTGQRLQLIRSMLQSPEFQSK